MIGAEVWQLILAGLAGFGGGLLDSIVGGGGLIMTPAMVNLFPGAPILQVIATQRTSSIFGAAVAARNYLRVIRFERRVWLSAALPAGLTSLFGVVLARRVPDDILKLVVLLVCLALAIYTFARKDFGQRSRLSENADSVTRRCGAVGAACGLYNGLIGPGTGTLMVFGFVSGVGFDFLSATALGKITNLASDLGSWLYLMANDYVSWNVAVPLVIGNMSGSYLGSHLALRKGSAFVRSMFLIVVSLLVARFTWRWLFG